jgi:hemolysin III
MSQLPEVPKKKRPSTHVGFYSFKEELINSATHGVGVALAFIGLIVLVGLALVYGNIWHKVSFPIYGISLVLLYLASTLYHGIQQPKAKRVLRLLDHSAVYLLIAGTYTPFLMVKMQTPLGWSLLTAVWIIAVVGILFKVFYIGRYEKYTTMGYVAMGWICLIGARQIVTLMPPWALFGLFLGGVVYTAGVLFFVWERIPYNHAIWHLFVMGGSAVHFFTVLLFVLPLSLIS